MEITMYYINNIVILLITIAAISTLIIFECQHSITLASIYAVLLIIITLIQLHNIWLRRENKKQKSSKHFTFDVMDNLPLGVITYDHQATITFINEACQKLLQVSHQDVVNKHANQLQHLPNIIILKDIAQLVLISGKAVHNQKISFQTNNFEQVECAVSADLLVGQQEKPGVICIVSDITMEINYNNLKRMSDTILQDMTGAVVAINNNLVITIHNKSAEGVFGYHSNEMIGKNLKEVMPNYYQSLTIYKALKLKKRITEEMQWNVGDKQIYLYSKADLLLDEDKNIVGAVCVSYDITEVKLKHKLALKQEKLAIVSQMTAGIAHELRNPLTAVRGLAQLISEKSPPQSQELFAVMLAELDRMEQLAQDFLHLSRDRRPELKETCINTLVNNLYTLNKCDCVNKNINFTTELERELPPVLADASQITQLLLNLLRNAIEAVTDKEQAIVSVKTKLINDERILITVQDNGSGIAAEDIKKLGTPFFSTKQHGTGLGLSICHDVIQQHGGVLQVESAINKGTCFKVYLPIKEDSTKEIINFD